MQYHSAAQVKITDHVKLDAVIEHFQHHNSDIESDIMNSIMKIQSTLQFTPALCPIDLEFQILDFNKTAIIFMSYCNINNVTLNH